MSDSSDLDYETTLRDRLREGKWWEANAFATSDLAFVFRLLDQARDVSELRRAEITATADDRDRWHRHCLDEQARAIRAEKLNEQWRQRHHAVIEMGMEAEAERDTLRTQLAAAVNHTSDEHNAAILAVSELEKQRDTLQARVEWMEPVIQGMADRADNFPEEAISLVAGPMARRALEGNK